MIFKITSYNAVTPQELLDDHPELQKFEYDDTDGFIFISDLEELVELVDKIGYPITINTDHVYYDYNELIINDL